TALQILDIHKSIALGIAAASRSGVQVDGNRSVRTGIACGILASTAVEGIDARTAIQRVVAGKTHKEIVELVASEDQPGCTGIGAQSLHFLSRLQHII